MKVQKTGIISAASLLLIVGLWAKVGCGSDNGVFIEPADSWYNPLPAALREKLQDKGELPDTDFCVAPGPMQKQAIKLLQNVPMIGLAEAQVAAFCPSKFNKKLLFKQGKKAYLVRAVFLNEFTGGYTIYSMGNILDVMHGSLGQQAVKMQRQALVVFLKKQPSQAFVDCFMAE